MSDLAGNIQQFNQLLEGKDCRLVAVSKTKPLELLQEAYDLGVRIFGENKVQEMADKYEHLPKDIQWHMIGHLQTNKVKYIAPFVSMIHSVDSFKILKEINKRARQNDRVINCLFQIHIADEETKFGLSEVELMDIIESDAFQGLENISMKGVMGMATNTDDAGKVRSEFQRLKNLFDKIKAEHQLPNLDFQEISMGMSGDYKLAIEEGSTMIRVGSLIFGARNYV